MNTENYETHGDNFFPSAEPTLFSYNGTFQSAKTKKMNESSIHQAYEGAIDRSEPCAENSLLVEENSCAQNSSPESQNIEIINETKVAITGIHVRAATLSKLIQVLIESFGNFLSAQV